MSNFIRAAYDPRDGKIKAAWFFDDHFDKHVYGVRFPDDATDHYFSTHEVEIPTDRVFVEEGLLKKKISSYIKELLYKFEGDKAPKYLGGKKHKKV